MLRPIFKTSLSEDKKGIKRAKMIREGEVVDQIDTFGKWFRAAFGDAVAMAARENIHVMRGAMRTFNLMEKPGEFLKDWRVMLTATRFMFRGREKNAAARLVRGPSRDEMLAAVRSVSSSEAA